MVELHTTTIAIAASTTHVRLKIQIILARLLALHRTLPLRRRFRIAATTPLAVGITTHRVAMAAVRAAWLARLQWVCNVLYLVISSFMICIVLCFATIIHCCLLLGSAYVIAPIFIFFLWFFLLVLCHFPLHSPYSSFLFMTVSK